MLKHVQHDSVSDPPYLEEEKDDGIYVSQITCFLLIRSLICLWWLLRDDFPVFISVKRILLTELLLLKPSKII